MYGVCMNQKRRRFVQDVVLFPIMENGIFVPERVNKRILTSQGK